MTIARGAELDPFAGSDDPNKALLNKLLAVPALRTRYLSYMRDIAERRLDWNKVGPLAQQYQAVIAPYVKIDTRKLDTTEAFTTGVTEDTAEQSGRGPGARPKLSLKSFFEQRRAYLLKHPEVSKAPKL